MNTEQIKKSIATIGIAGLIASVSLMTGCKKQAETGVPASDQQVTEDTTAACGQMMQADSVAAEADTTSSCGQ